MESTANINNTNTTGIFNEIPIKIRYISHGITITENWNYIPIIIWKMHSMILE